MKKNLIEKNQLVVLLQIIIAGRLGILCFLP